MVSKFIEKNKAIELRKQGLSYREILQKVPVAKSTLSLWFKSVDISESQKQRLTQKKLLAALRGAKKRKEQRIQITQYIKESAIRDISKITKRELWLMGIMLYWAEGSKEKEGKWGTGVIFNNSDPYMIKLFLKWLLEIIEIIPQDIKFEIYVHENHKKNLKRIRKFWSRVTGFSMSNFNSVYFKKNKINTKRKNTGDRYYGLLRIKVRASSALNRKIFGWIEGINRYYWGVVQW